MTASKSTAMTDSLYYLFLLLFPLSFPPAFNSANSRPFSPSTRIEEYYVLGNPFGGSSWNGFDQDSVKGGIGWPVSLTQPQLVKNPVLW
jgi:hypothetical protein